MTQNATTERHLTTPPARRTPALTAYSVLIGLATVAILLQGVWAGIFLEHDGKRDASSSWIDAHARGGEIAIVLSLIAFVVAAVKLRHRKDLLVGTGALAVLLIGESYIGGLIRNDGKDTLTAVHVPLAMAIIGLAVWLPVRVRSGRASARR